MPQHPSPFSTAGVCAAQRPLQQARLGLTFTALAAALLFAPHGARAQVASAPVAVAIQQNAQPLDRALTALAARTGILIGVDANLVRDKQAPALNGSYTPEQALAALLAGSGLEAGKTGEKSYALRAKTPAVPAPAGVPATSVPGDRSLASVTVRETRDGPLYRDDGYLARGSTAGSKVELPLKDIPQSISVINQDFLRDLAPARINHVADYVAGVDSLPIAATPYTNAYFFRGFGSAQSTTYNGFRDRGFLSAQALVNLERVEFLKGPSSVLYGGSTGLSGLVNYVSKQPLSEPFHEVTLGGGSFDHRYTQLDATGPITDDKSLRYRLTASHDQGGNHKRGYDQRSTFISPYISWDLTRQTRLDIELAAQDTRFDGREAFLPRHPVSFLLPVETNLGPGGRGADGRRLARFDLRHRFDNGFTLRQGFYLSNVDKTEDFSFQVQTVNPDGRTATRIARTIPELERDRSSQTELSGAFKTGSLTHDFLIGMEFTKSRFSFDLFNAPATGVDLFNPQPGTQTGPFPTTSTALNVQGAETRALYAQDLIDLTGGFKLMLGGRYDDVEQFAKRRGTQPAAGNLVNEKAFSPRIGLIYQPVPATSWYGSYTRSFAPQLGISRTGQVFDSQQGAQVEVGVKHDLRPDLALTVALFDYKRNNVLTADPDAPVGSGFSIAVGQQHTRGIELELAGQITRNYSVVASYGYLDAKVSRDNRLPVGDRLAGVQRHSLGIFNKLRLGMFGVPAWSATLGLVHASERESGLPNNTAAFTAAQLRIPSYTRLDAGLIYESGPYTFRLTGSNLTDEKLYDTQGSTLYTRPPRAWTASLGVKF